MSVVFIIHGDSASREALAAAVRAGGWRAETFADAQTFLRQPRLSGPACLVLDVALPDMGRLDLQSLCADRPELPVIFTARAVPSFRAVVLAMKAGAVDFLPAPFDEQLLLSAVRTAIERSGAAEVLVRRYESLTLRERQVMAQVIAGRMNKRIAEDLGISVITVKAHRGKVMRKMQAASLADLVNMSVWLGEERRWLNTSMTPAGDCSSSPLYTRLLRHLPASLLRPASHLAR